MGRPKVPSILSCLLVENDVVVADAVVDEDVPVDIFLVIDIVVDDENVAFLVVVVTC